MKKGTIEFYKCIQDSQELGSDDDHMVSRVFFRFTLDGTTREMTANIKQIAGGGYEADPLEVQISPQLKGPFNYAAFRNAAEEYYRGLVGSNATGIRIANGSGVRMYDNTFIRTMRFDINVQEDGFTW